MRRKIIRITLLIAVLSACMAVSTFAFDLQGGIVETESAVNLRKEPNTDADVLDKLYNESRVAVFEQQGDWYRVAYNGVNGWLHSDYVAVQDIMNISCGGAKVTTATLNLRAKPTTDADVIGQLSEGETVRIIGINSGWFKISCGKGTGYIHPDYVKVTKLSSSGGGSSSSSSSGSVSLGSGSLRWDIVNYAAKFLGTKYVYGGESPSGFDCSGLVQYVYAHFGIDLPRNSASQYRSSSHIKKANLNIGDLVFFSGTGGGSSVGHVGIYVGGGQFIHAPSPGKTVCYESLSSSYYSSHYIGSGTYLG